MVMHRRRLRAFRAGYDAVRKHASRLATLARVERGVSTRGGQYQKSPYHLHGLPDASYRLPDSVTTCPMAGGPCDHLGITVEGIHRKETIAARESVRCHL